MFISNKIKAMYNWVISILFLFSCIIEMIIEPEQFLLFSKYIIASLILILYGFHILRAKRILKFVEESLIIVSWFILCSLLIYQTNGIYSHYFPSFYFIVLIYASFIKQKSYYIIFNVLGIITLLSWALFSNQNLIWSNIQGYILNILIYLAFLLVIKSYSSICLLCDRDNESYLNRNLIS